MKWIKSDAGDWVIAQGAPGSVARVRQQYPLLIQVISEKPVQQAAAIIIANGVTGPIEQANLLFAAGMPETVPGI